MTDDATNASPTDRPVNVLLVDDLPANLLVLEAILDGPDRRLVRATRGEDALRYLAEDDFAVVLLDVWMPGLDGFQTAHRIRAQGRSRHTPIIFVTGYDTTEFPVPAAYELGAVDYLVKPLVPAILRAKVGVFIALARQAARIRDLERDRVARAAAEAEARRKDEFLATIAHELRNPLAPLRNGVQVLRMAPDAGTVASVVGMLERQVSHLSRLVDDLLDVARVGQNKLRLRTERVDLRRAAEMAVEGTRPFLEAAGHRFVVRLAREPVELVADPGRLAQVVTNLLTNAGKYTPRGGDVELVVGVEDREAVVRVRDTGVGIPPAMLPKVFDLFAQVEHSLDHSQGGLGIGLALVKRLVEAHGGTVEALSDGPGTGSEFVVRLPLAVG